MVLTNTALKILITLKKLILGIKSIQTLLIPMQNSRMKLINKNKPLKILLSYIFI
ncbi:hypothetical protein Desor_1242 [Desulfosporosinus orientis DSM 765]|uniref:Uncharacterized protein n=1 Tax=Desulfosporosinus orientis (strain ATCC 19365 / DSM 765 / NCIMB 8382 / VKM B-1628 / Singapore I) TaxID=768706 RepID=G7WEL4_DESOD|nr:hypothetical protein Desor_1242 [Desulfosporosinus orientis DSM 765]